MKRESASDPSDIASAFIAACDTEVQALKPGNVHVFASGHGMEVVDFIKSARAAAPHIANPNLAVGARIKAAVVATFAAVGCNTNLGIVLLCAPLAAAAQGNSTLKMVVFPNQGKSGSGRGNFLRSALLEVLSDFSGQDTSDVFSAIATANPGGIGSDQHADVRSAPPPGMTLMKAMEIAAPRDLIANEYVTGFPRVFELYEKQYVPRTRSGWSTQDAIARTFLHALARVPDTHIARKYGTAAASAVRDQADAFEKKHFADPETFPSAPATQPELLAFDAELKAQGFNPGSLADLMAAVLFLAELEQLSARRRNPVTSR